MKIAIRRLFAVFFLPPLLFANAAFASEWLLLSDFTLIDGSGAPARDVKNLVVKDGVILGIDGASLEAPAPKDEVTRIDLDGAYVMPGLIDTHVHVGRFPDARNEAERILKLALRGGVTTVRDLAGDARALAEINRAVARGDLVAPTVVYSAVFGGPSLFEKDTRLTRYAVGYAPGAAPWLKAITNESDLKIDVAEAKGAGAAVIKLYGNVDERLAERLIREGREQQLFTVAHATVFSAGPEALVDAGVRSLAHAPYLVWQAIDKIPNDYKARTEGPWKDVPADHPKLISLFQKMADKGVSLDATLFVYREMHSFSPNVQAGWTGDALKWSMDVVRVAHENGVPITTGTDWFEPRTGEELPHTHEELALLVEAGLSPMDAIVASVKNGAAACGVENERGVLAPGMAADLLVLDKNPLVDIRNTKEIRFVVKDGRIVS